jgi:hypothetical protein
MNHNPPKAEVRGSNPFGRASYFNQLRLGGGINQKPGKQRVSTAVGFHSKPTVDAGTLGCWLNAELCSGSYAHIHSRAEGHHFRLGGSQMKGFILLVTWIVSGQPPSSHQATFTSAEACNAARDAVLADGRRLKAEAD